MSRTAVAEIGRLVRGLRNPQTGLDAGSAAPFPLRSLTKIVFGAALLAVGVLTIYEHVIVRVSREGKTPRFRRRLVNLAKIPSTALSH